MRRDLQTPRTALWALALGLLLSLPPALAHAGDDDGQCPGDGSICVNAGEASWTQDQQASAKARRKDRKRNRKRDPIPVTVKIEGGRGSVFVDGRWAGEAPLEGFEIKPGRHNIQVRDGATVLGYGILKISRKSGPIELLVSHPEAGPPEA